MSTLLIKPLNESAKKSYMEAKESYIGDSGFDLYVFKDISILPGQTLHIPLGISCEMINNQTSNNESYYLYPRSSISYTPLVLANSVGIIDAGYRGELIAAVKYIPTNHDIQLCRQEPYIIKKHSRLFQLCRHNLEPFPIKIVDSLSVSDRNNKGFGSTGA